jgi:2-keto-myo-inositol isomerase
LRPPAFFALARQLGIADVEIRNDISGNAILDGTPAREVREQAADAGIGIATINGLQRFNEWDGDRAREATELADYAHDVGAKALALVPVNGGQLQADSERQSELRRALDALRPILSARGLKGFIEPLGFETCSLRSKREAVEAIRDTGGEGVFSLVHDTFHHYLAGEPELFPDQTGIVHISGVIAPDLPLSAIRDSHRVLVDETDRMENLPQIRALLDRGYAGLFSFEPFAEEIQTLENPVVAFKASLDFIQGNLT